MSLVNSIQRPVDRCCIVLACLCLLALPRAAEADPTVEQTAELLLRTTVTVRISPAAASAPASAKVDAERRQPAPQLTAEKQPADEPLPDGVSVGSGVSLGNGRIVTFSRLPFRRAGTEQLEFRVTLPGGEQAAAAPRVIDDYSGLVLLEIERRDLPALMPADELPKVGATVLTASAAGIEQPLVSQGVLSGIGRTIPGASLPPMVQCDISTTDAASGAALVDRRQRLIGIVAATDAASQQFGWSFAIPYPHIRRVLDAYVPDRMVVLTRQRPVVGLRLGPGESEGTVVVERVEPGGPADKAGIRQGESVFEADGRKIRSAYQAVALILKRLPGEKMTFLVGSDDTRRLVTVTLHGSAVEPAPPEENDNAQYQVGPQVNVRAVGPNRYEVRNRQRVAELSVTEQDVVPSSNAPAAPEAELQLLKRQLKAYQELINVLQQERLEQQKFEAQQQADLESLRQEIQKLQSKRPAK